MKAAGANDRNGKTYNQHYSAAMDEHKWIREIDKGVRSRLQECIDHLAEVEAWYATLSQTERLKWNHPNAVYNHWKAATKPPTTKKGPSKTEQRIADLEDELEESEKLNVELTDEVEKKGETITTLQRELESEKKWHSADPAKTVELEQRVEMAERVAAQAAEETQTAMDQAEAARADLRLASVMVQSQKEEVERLHADIARLQERAEKSEREASGANAEGKLTGKADQSELNTLRARIVELEAEVAALKEATAAEGVERRSRAAGEVTAGGGSSSTKTPHRRTPRSKTVNPSAVDEMMQMAKDIILETKLEKKAAAPRRARKRGGAV
jgi:chromosome segregation ATPase